MYFLIELFCIWSLSSLITFKEIPRVPELQYIWLALLVTTRHICSIVRLEV